MDLPQVLHEIGRVGGQCWTEVALDADAQMHVHVLLVALAQHKLLIAEGALKLGSGVVQPHVARHSPLLVPLATDLTVDQQLDRRRCTVAIPFVELEKEEVLVANVALRRGPHRVIVLDMVTKVPASHELLSTELAKVRLLFRVDEFGVVLQGIFRGKGFSTSLAFELGHHCPSHLRNYFSPRSNISLDFNGGLVLGSSSLCSRLLFHIPALPHGSFLCPIVN